MENKPLKNLCRTRQFILMSIIKYIRPLVLLKCKRNLFRIIVIYGSVVWDTLTTCTYNELEFRFLRIIKYTFYIYGPLYHYTPVLRFINFSSLADRGKFHNISFLQKLQILLTPVCLIFQSETSAITRLSFQLKFFKYKIFVMFNMLSFLFQFKLCLKYTFLVHSLCLYSTVLYLYLLLL